MQIMAQQTVMSHVTVGKLVETFKTYIDDIDASKKISRPRPSQLSRIMTLVDLSLKSSSTSLQVPYVASEKLQNAGGKIEMRRKRFGSSPYEKLMADSRRKSIPSFPSEVIKGSSAHKTFQPLYFDNGVRRDSKIKRLLLESDRSRAHQVKEYEPAVHLPSALLPLFERDREKSSRGDVQSNTMTKMTITAGPSRLISMNPKNSTHRRLQSLNSDISGHSRSTQSPHSVGDRSFADFRMGDVRDQTRTTNGPYLQYGRNSSEPIKRSSMRNNIVSRSPSIGSSSQQRLHGMSTMKSQIQCQSSNSAGVCSIQGFKPGNTRWINQDSFMIEERQSGRDVGIRIYCVFDGHGQEGHVISQRCASRLKELLLLSEMNLTEAFENLHSEIIRTKDVNSKCSGTTCVLALVSQEAIKVANIGDSRCIMGKLKVGTDCAERSGCVDASMYMVVPLSRDHKPDRDDECSRIRSMGGIVSPKQIVVGSNDHGPVRVPMGPARVWYNMAPGVTMGLAMSRSIGDSKAHSFGVINTPEITVHFINSTLDKFLILATDGVWDVISNEDCVRLVAQSLADQCDLSKAAHALAMCAQSKWDAASTTRDDITAMVVKL